VLLDADISNPIQTKRNLFFSIRILFFRSSSSDSSSDRDKKHSKHRRSKSKSPSHHSSRSESKEKDVSNHSKDGNESDHLNHETIDQN
jgi:hypothetical protein